MAAIFISYRREDTAGNAGRIYDRLVDRFGRERVYRDIDSGQPGEDFVETIRSRIEGSGTLLALIGPNWLKATDEQGGWRLASDDDLVRVEIATALERGIRVIPVLLHGAKMPRAGDLPSALSKLAQRNAVEIRDTHFEQDVSQLLESLAPRWFHQRWVRALTRPEVWAVVALLVVAGVGAVYLSQTALTPEQARARLAQMDIAYTPDAFVKAAELKDVKAVELFLKAGMDPNAADRQRVTALQFAASHGNLPLMSALLKAGAKTTDEALVSAAAAGQVEALRMLLSNGPPKAALDRASIAAVSEPGALRVLLDHGADPNAVDRDGGTALMEAARRAKPEAIKLLLAKGANVNAARTDRWTRGRTSLYVAAGGSADQGATIEAAKLLLDEGADVNARSGDVNNSEGWTPLLAALRNERWKIARFLIERGADVNVQAIARSDSDERFGIGLTPLMLTAREGEVDTSVALLGKGADVGMRTLSGRTALSFAAEKGSLPLVEVLLSRGAKVNDTNKQGFTPLMLASTVEVTEALLRHGADVGARTTRGGTALLIAAERATPETVKLLLSKGANPDAVDDRGWTPLMAAAFAGRTDNARALVDTRARIHTTNNAGETALDIAKKEGSQGVVDVLLAAKRVATPSPRK
ncbi:MAG: ankyrin repeat domain-containing protein [Burkholderiales bacterium]